MVESIDMDETEYLLSSENNKNRILDSIQEYHESKEVYVDIDHVICLAGKLPDSDIEWLLGYCENRLGKIFN